MRDRTTRVMLCLNLLFLVFYNYILEVSDEIRKVAEADSTMLHQQIPGNKKEEHH
jgi:hypothetical protein